MKFRITLSKLSHLLVSGYIGFVGIVVIFSTIFTRLHDRIHITPPFDLVHASRTLSLVVGFLLTYFSLQLVGRRRRAYDLAVLSLIALAVLALVEPHRQLQLAIYLVGLVLLFIDHTNYNVKSDNVRLWRGAVASIAMALITLSYATIGFYLLQPRDLGVDLTFQQSFNAALSQLFTFQGHLFTTYTRHAAWFLESVNVAAVTTIVIMIRSLFRPLQFVLAPSHHDTQKAHAILRQYANSTEDYFKLWPADKHYYFSQAHDAFVAYKVADDVALILDGPSGKKESYQSLLGDFLNFARENDWRVAIIHADHEVAQLASGIGLDRLYIGYEAIVDIAQFMGHTAHDKHFRYITNRAERENLSFEVWEPPINDHRLAQLFLISQAWQSQNDRREYTFAMAPFSQDFLRQSEIAVVSQHGEPIAYSNILPSFVVNARSVDHMRSKPNAPSVSMHFLFLKLIERLSSQGVAYFNLGLSPLSTIEHRIPDSNLERALTTLKALGSSVYSVSGVERFKAYYRPLRAPRFICYQKGIPNLLRTVVALNSAMRVPRQGSRLRYVVAIAIIAAICYSSFPLASILDSNLVLHGSVSALGAAGQPYAWLFNLLDIISGSFVVAITLAIGRSMDNKNAYTIASLYAFGLAGAGGILAAIFSLPPIATPTNGSYEFFFHDFTSFLNFAGFVASSAIVIAFGLTQKNKNTITNWYAAVFVGVSFWALVAYVVGDADAIERLLIVLTSGWIILYSYFTQSRVTTKISLD